MPINEILKFDVNWNGSNRASATTIINDTSRPEYEYSLVASMGSTDPITEIDIPTYVLTANKSTMNEGESVIFSLTTTKLDPDTIIPFTITGITVADITADSLTGNFVIDASGKASLTIVTIADYVTEVNMNMVVTLDNLGVSQSVTLNDTSHSPTYAVGWYSDAGGVNPISATNEGSSVYLVLKTTAVVDGTNFSVGLSGTNITTGDVASGTLVGSITINSNIGYLNLSFVNDLTTEGIETIRGSVSYNSTVVVYNDLVINDTSTTVSENNHLLFTVGTLSGNNRVLKGYDNGMEGVYGNLLNDTLKYGGQLLDSLASTIHYREDNGGLALQYWYNNYATISDIPLNFKITNMTTGEYYITGNVNGGHVTFNGVYWHDVPTASVDLLNRIYTVGQNVKVELI